MKIFKCDKIALGFFLIIYFIFSTLGNLGMKYDPDNPIEVLLVTLWFTLLIFLSGRFIYEMDED